MRYLLILVCVIICMVVNVTRTSSQEAIVELNCETMSTDDDIESFKKHQRMPPLPITCYITEDGVAFDLNGLKASDCLVFEINDPIARECVFSTSSEIIFVDKLLSMRGEFNIVFRFENTILTGYCYIE